MTNRHDRRAQEAQARKSFEDYDATYRKAFRKADAREIGEGWMRGAKIEADGIAGYVIHPPGMTLTHADCDAAISAAYGAQRFKVVARAADLDVLARQWAAMLEAPNTPFTADPRHDTRDFIFRMIVTNQQYDDVYNAILIASAIVWLAKTSAVGLVLGDSHSCVHYEITDTAPGQRNFRLMMS